MARGDGTGVRDFGPCHGRHVQSLHVTACSVVGRSASVKVQRVIDHGRGEIGTVGRRRALGNDVFPLPRFWVEAMEFILLENCALPVKENLLVVSPTLRVVVHSQGRAIRGVETREVARLQIKSFLLVCLLVLAKITTKHPDKY